MRAVIAVPFTSSWREDSNGYHIDFWRDYSMMKVKVKVSILKSAEGGASRVRSTEQGNMGAWRFRVTLGGGG